MTRARPSFLRRLVRSVRLIYSVAPRLLLALCALALLRGVIPAVLALTARALVNGAADSLHQGLHSLVLLWPWLLAALAATLAEAVGTQVQQYGMRRLRDELHHRVTVDLLAQACRLDLGFFEDHRRRALIERARLNMGERLSTLAADLLASAIALLQAASLTLILIHIEPLIILAAAPLAIPYLAFQWRISRQRHAEESSRTEKRRWADYWVRQLTTPEHVAEVKLLGLGPHLVERFRVMMDQFVARDRTLLRRALAGSSLFAVLTTLALYAVFIRVALRALQGGLTLGDIAIFGGATARLRGVLERAAQCAGNVMEQSLFAEDLQEFLHVEPAATESSDLRPLSLRGEVEFRGVTFTYPGAEAPALVNVSLHIQPGETVAIVGVNGSGKTTLAKLIARLYDPQSGALLLDGVNAKELSARALRARIGFVMQDFGRYEASLAENIAYGDWARLRDQPEEIARLAGASGLDGLARSLPQGLDTHLGRWFGEHDLSEGQWQQVAAARALVRQPDLFILDEPTAHLDAHAEYELFSRFREQSRGRTTILISHRFTTLGLADRILVMDRGQVVEAGTHADLMKKDGHYAALFKRQRSYLAAE